MSTSTPAPVLTEPQVQLLADLVARGQHGQCYLVGAGRGRYALVAPDGSGRLYRLRAMNGKTVDRPHELGLVEHAFYRDGGQRIEFRGRRPLDGRVGSSIVPTDAGRTALAVALAELLTPAQQLALVRLHRPDAVIGAGHPLAAAARITGTTWQSLAGRGLAGTDRLDRAVRVLTPAGTAMAEQVLALIGGA